MRLLVCSFLAGLVFGIGTSRAEGPSAAFDGLFPDGRVTESLRALADREKLAPDEGFKVVELGRDANLSHHLVWIRDREQPHRHDRHDLVAVIVRGFGHMRLGDEERAVGRGSILFIPRGTVHAFRNESGETAMAYALYSPAFDGQDRVLVSSGASLKKEVGNVAGQLSLLPGEPGGVAKRSSRGP